MWFRYVACVGVGDGDDWRAASFAVIGSDGCSRFEDFARGFLLVARLQDYVASGNIGGVKPPVARLGEFGAEDVVVFVSAAGEDGPSAGEFVPPEILRR